jgi:hypothetical protein
LLILAATAVGQEGTVPFVIPGDDGSESPTNFSRLIEAPVPEQFVTTRDGHFFVGDKRLRVWGVNLCFGANFPTHEEAKKIAPHFAKLGINAVRFHHMDMQDAPEGIWKTLPSGKRILDPQQIDRLDFFLNELHKQGIYANINLHVSRTLTEAEGFPVTKGQPWWAASNKWVMYYDPDVQAELKKFCRELLTHNNPYRNRRRVDDPGIAFVEMLNENYFSVQGTSLLRFLPDRYVKSFGKKWNQWLAKKYGSTAKMRSEWTKDQGKLGTPLFTAADWTRNLDKWGFTVTGDTYEPTFGIAGPNNLKAVRFAAPSRSEQAHFQQLSYRGFRLQKGKPYTLSYWVRSDKPREFNMEVSTTESGEWQPIGMFEPASAGPEWKQVRKVFFPKGDAKEAYIALSIGADKTPIEFCDVRLNGGVESQKLADDQSIENGNIGVPVSGWPLPAINDLNQFMVDTERDWLVELKRFLTEDLGVRVPITASQENYHAEGLLASTMDFVDLHNYWHHPTFPAGKSFNPTDYRTGQEPIESFPTRSGWPTNSLLMRSGWRYFGMPFTLSEWNHAEPGDVNSGAVMMAAVMASIQDWDAVYFFDYSQTSKRWFADHFEGFFDINSQPVKLATVAVGANIFLRGDLPALKTKRHGTFGDRLDGRLAFSHLVGVEPSATAKNMTRLPDTLKADAIRLETPDKALIWDSTKPEKAYLTLKTPRSQGAWGLIAGQSFALPNVELEVGSILRNYGTLVATTLDDAASLADSKSILLLASSGAENTNMQWNADRTSVSDKWGTGPTRINPVPAKVRISNRSVRSVFALDGTGKRMKEVPVKQTADGIEFSIDGQFGTLWYLVTTK